MSKRTFEQRRRNFWATRKDAQRLIYLMAGHIGPIPPHLQEYFVQAEVLRGRYEQDAFDHIGSQLGLPDLDAYSKSLKGIWKIKRLCDIPKNEPFRLPLGASGIVGEDLYIKRGYVDTKDKYRIEPLTERKEPQYSDFFVLHFSPRFKVYVRDND